VSFPAGFLELGETSAAALKFVALNADDGALRWSFQLDTEPLGKPFIDDGRVWFIDRDGRVYLVE